SMSLGRIRCPRRHRLRFLVSHCLRCQRFAIADTVVRGPSHAVPLDEVRIRSSDGQPGSLNTWTWSRMSRLTDLLGLEERHNFLTRIPAPRQVAKTSHRKQHRCAMHPLVNDKPGAECSIARSNRESVR